MVHGGGHHQRGGGGGGGGGWNSGNSRDRGGWGGNSRHHRGGRHRQQNPFGGWLGRPYQDNIVIVNNTPASYGSLSWYNQRSSYFSGHRREEECRECCGACCRGACLALGCFTLASAVERQMERSHAASIAPILSPPLDFDATDRAVSFDDPPPKCNPLCPWSFLSTVLLLVLLVASSVKETWTFNPGETRYVPVQGWFTRDIHIVAQTSNSVNVYDIHGQCPPLNGPPVALSDKINIKLPSGDYQFDYFFLNKGSTVDLVVTQGAGATNVMILKGTDSLQESDEEDDDESFSKQAILTRYAGEGQEIHVQYVVSSNDMYVLLYDSASSQTGHATVQYHVNLTTYNLDGFDPISTCSPLECDTTVSTTQCILIQAVQDSPAQTSHKTKTEPTTVHITSDRRWPSIVFVALLPLVAGFLVRWRSSSDAASKLAYDSIPPMSPPPSTVDLPKAPSAPVEPDNDYESIPIVTGPYVMPVAVPVETQ